MFLNHTTCPNIKDLLQRKIQRKSGEESEKCQLKVHLIMIF